MTESRLWPPSTREGGNSLRRSSVPQPAKASHDGGCADRSGARCLAAALSASATLLALWPWVESSRLSDGRGGGERPRADRVGHDTAEQVATVRMPQVERVAMGGAQQLVAVVGAARRRRWWAARERLARHVAPAARAVPDASNIGLSARWGRIRSTRAPHGGTPTGFGTLALVDPAGPVPAPGPAGMETAPRGDDAAGHAFLGSTDLQPLGSRFGRKQRGGLLGHLPGRGPRRRAGHL